MRFLMMWKPAENAASLAPPPAQLMADIDQLMADMYAANSVIDAGGMRLGGRLHLADGRVTVTDGPFAEAKEMIGGYCILRVAAPEEAIAAARRFVDIHAAHGYAGESEILQLVGAEEQQAPQQEVSLSV